MDLKTFVSTTLTQIVDGVKDAQKQPEGHVAADGYIGSHGNLITGGTSGFFTVVEFDVVVSAETSDGGSSVRVADVERISDSKTSSSNLSRVKFSVHVRLPRGGKNADPQYGRTYSHEADYDPLSTF